MLDTLIIGSRAAGFGLSCALLLASGLKKSFV